MINLDMLLPVLRDHRSVTDRSTHTPGQVSFSPDGSQLVVTTKANGNDIDVFSVAHGGQLSTSPVINAEAGTVPFALTFVELADDPVLPGPDVNPDGTLTAIGSVAVAGAAGGEGVTAF